MPVIGLEKIGVYPGRLSLSIDALVAARSLDGRRYIDEYLLQERSVFAPFEDSVSMSANAARLVLHDADRANIILLLVATESAVDFGKPVSTWVQRLCGLPSSIRNLEVKHACYGLTGAVRLAQAFLAAHPNPEAKALVVGADASRHHIGDPAEPICGGAATALLLSRNPGVIALDDPGGAGVWSRETPDTFRPTATVECGNNDLSLFSYLDALAGSLTDFRGKAGEDFHPETSVRHNVYHAPFPAMTFQAHRQVLKSFGTPGPGEIRRSFNERVLPGLEFSRRLGTSYGSSVWIALAALAGRIEAPAEAAVFSYGSGCQSEFFRASLTPDPGFAARLRADLDARTGVDVAAYSQIEEDRLEQAEAADFVPFDQASNRELVEAAFRGDDWILAGVDQHVRRYIQKADL